MISSKHFSKIAVILTSFVVILCLCSMFFYEELFFITNTSGYSLEYPDILFDTNTVPNIDISMDQDDWQEMLDKAIEENYYECDVTINGTTFYKVGIRPKGNTSLSAVANDPENNRYSLKLEFDHFIDSQTCFGLDKLILNNNYADATNMKEAIVYDMFQFLGVEASLYNYAKISVNDEYWGIYLALEAVEDSFMLRNYGTKKGYLYKPDSMNQSAKGQEKNTQDNKGHGKGGFSNKNGGANLNYIDDDLDSYSTIWDSSVTESTKADHMRVVNALKNINDRNDIEKYIDIEQTLKYMAVHNFSVNEDSLSGSMAHNYYLYESDGQIAIIPWDYNLSFGGMNGKNATDMVNDPIDDKYSSTKLFDFVFENEEYQTLYHEYYNKLVEKYLYGGKFEETYQRIRTQIDDLVKTDPNSMYTFDEYTNAAEILHKAIMLRAESVKGQLEGTIPQTTETQKENSSSLIDAADINLSDMGEFMGGGGKGGPEMHGNQPNMPQGNSPDMPQNNQPDMQAGNSPDMPQNNQPNMPQGNPPDMPQNGGNASQTSMPTNNRDNFRTKTNSDKQQEKQQGENFPPSDNSENNLQKDFSDKNPPQNNAQSDKSREQNFQPNMQNSENFQSQQQNTQPKSNKSIVDHVKEYSVAYISLLILAAAFVFIKKY